MACRSIEDSPKYFDTEARVTREIANMKEALSTASLPQQGSPGCDAQRFISERPYGSLKKRRSSRQRQTQWRRSWASGSGQSLNSVNSSLGSLGMDEFYAAVRGDYDYIMDTNLIDSCRDAHCDLESNPPFRDGASDLHMALKPQQWRQPETAARKDIVLLRRWLRDVEARLEAHSLRDATRWTRERQQRCLGELADLQLEISAQGRVVGALLRAYAKEDKSKEEISINSGSSENSSSGDYPRGIRGLERRYHLLYLRALEWQCLLEGLLASSIPSTPTWTCAQSDHEEEPVPKQAKLSTDFKRKSKAQQLTDTSDDDESLALTSHPKADLSGSSRSLGSGTSSEADVESLDGAPPTANGLSIHDTSSSDMDTDSDINDNKDLVLTKITDTVIKRVKNIEISKYNRSNRTAENVATFYFKHRDTDSELDHRSNVALTSSELDAEEDFQVMSSESDNEKQNEMSSNEQKLENFVNGNVPYAKTVDQLDNANVAGNGEIIVPTVRMNATRKNQENIMKLVQEAEHLVREDSERNRLEKQGRSRNYDNTNRIKEWLRKSATPCIIPKVASGVSPLDSCDASDESTSSSDSEAGCGAHAGSAESSGEPSGSVATYRRALGDSQATSTELIDTDSNGAPTATMTDTPPAITPDNSSPVKVVLRSANKTSGTRPWSVSCVSQLTPNMEILNAEHLQNEIAVNGLQKNKMAGQFSHSESALHILDNSVNYHGDLNKADSKFDSRKKKFRLKKRQGRKSESSNDPNESALGLKQGNLVKSRSFSGHSQNTLEKILATATQKIHSKSPTEKCHVMMPVNFEIGGNITNAPILENLVTSEEHSSSFSEAWDNYQDKYLSESYSECVDTEAARKLLDFGEDYRNYIDSQSDCCSSLSNFASNLDVGNKKFLKNLIANSPDYIRKSIDDYSFDNSDGTDLDCRRRRPDLHLRRRPSKERRNSKMTSDSDSSKNSSNAKRKNNFNGAELDLMKRKSNSKLKLKSRTNTMTDSDSDLDELRRLVTESKVQLDRSEALWCSNDPRSETDRGVILQPRDYAEIILTCRENIRCLEAVMTRACGAILNDVQGQNLRGKFKSSTPLGVGKSNIKVPNIILEHIETKAEISAPNFVDKTKVKSVKPQIKRAKISSSKNDFGCQSTSGCLNCNVESNIRNNLDKKICSQNFYNINISKRGTKKSKFIRRKNDKKNNKIIKSECKCQSDIYNKLCEISNKLNYSPLSENNNKLTLQSVSTNTDDKLTNHLSNFFNSLYITPSNKEVEIVNTDNSFLNNCGQIRTVCKCHPIGKFISFVINYISDWSNYLWNSRLFIFLLRTLQQFILLIFGIKYQITNNIKRLLML